MKHTNELPKYNVIKLCKLVKSTKNEGEFLFRDKDGRIYFIDKKGNSDLLKDLAVDVYHVVWVVKEAAKVGYVRVSVDGLSVPDFILGLVDLEVNDYLDMKDAKYTDSVFFTNYMYNHDIKFNKYLAEENDEEQTDVEVGLFNQFDRIGFNDERSEWVVEKAKLDRYLTDGQSRKY